MHATIKDFIPPVVFKLHNKIKPTKTRPTSMTDPDKQDLDVYYQESMAQTLDNWGEGNVWEEIQLLMANCTGKILDIACGTGKTIEILQKFNSLNIFGCDISDLLIQKAIDKGIPAKNLIVCDATNMNYEDNFFDFSYSIGSLEHFTEDGITKFIKECNRITKKGSFHMLPVSRLNENEGWVKTFQSFHNNRVDWWKEKFQNVFDEVHVINSKWEDKISYGKWFINLKK